MRLFRKVIFWCHLAAGVFAGVVVLVMSVTGVLLAYERQLTAWADTRGYRAAPPAPGASRLPVEALLAGVREARPGSPSAFTVRADPSAPAEVGFGREGVVYVNPYTGEVLGEGSRAVRRFFRVVTDWHRWLGASGEGAGRTVGRAVTGACNLAFLFLVVSGFYLWWPRNWTRKSLRGVTWFRRGLGGRARDFNWHNVAGFWSALPLFVVVLSGVVISYNWAGALVYRVVGETPPAARGGAPGQPGGNVAPAQGGAAGGVDAGRPAGPAAGDAEQLWASAGRRMSDWQSISMRIPAPSEPTVTFTLDRGDGGQPQKRAQLTLDRRTGEVVRWEPFASQSPGRRLRSLLRFAHTGEVAGLFGQTIAALASAAAVLLVWSGLALAWRRFRAWSARRGVGPDEAAARRGPAAVVLSDSSVGGSE
ncbi:MAG TPA: PepSY-associated TM helix domain-containing protein [Pyrinomonadaceae bacterium]|jgi:uncharacterized iron-regulated membrane protein